MKKTAGHSEKISVIIPALNEAESLPELIGGIRDSIPKGMPYEVIVVDDGSDDGTVKVVREIAAENPAVHLISFRRNFGKAAALESGFRHATGTILITMDGDLQDDPAEIPRFLAKLNKGYDLVSGWKKDRKDPLEKRVPSRVFNAIVSRMSGIRLHDFNCGFKAYRREVTDSLDLYGELHRYIPCLAARRGFRIAELPVRHRRRRYGKSKYGLGRYLRGMLDAVTVFFLMRFEEQPMHLFGRLGLLSCLAGTGICVYLTVLWFGGHPIGHRPLLMLGVLLLVAGIQLFSLGLLGELVVKLNHRRDEDESRIREQF